MTRQSNPTPRVVRAVGRNGCCVPNATGANAGRLCALPALPGRDRCFRHLYVNIDVTVSDGERESNSGDESAAATETDSFIATSDNDSDSLPSSGTSDEELLHEIALEAAQSSNSSIASSRSTISSGSAGSISSGSTHTSNYVANTQGQPQLSLSSRLRQLERWLLPWRKRYANCAE